MLREVIDGRLIVVFGCAGERARDRRTGLGRVAAQHADLAILMEPTGAWVEAGCQGALVVEATFHGERAHSARPWMGANAIHKLGPVLDRIAAHESETVLVDGLEYRESLEAVHVSGGVANNVVPDAGKIQIQSEGAEIRYRRIDLYPIWSPPPASPSSRPSYVSRAPSPRATPPASTMAPRRCSSRRKPR